MSDQTVIVASYQGHTVEVESVYECGGVKLASVRAIAGEPFVSGLKWPVRSAHGIVPVNELENVCYAWKTSGALHLQKAAEVGWCSKST
jgi:hypothetical protein